MRNNDLLAVSEIFGPTFQGEGKNIGLPVMFLRLSGCNQHCVWCDTPYTWRFTDKYPHEWNTVYDPKKEIHKMSIGEVKDVLMKHLSLGNLVVSGGEPMLQQDNLFHLFRELKRDGWKHIEMETAGSIKPIYSNDIDLFTVSIKLSNSGNPRSLSIRPYAIAEFVRDGRAIFKFVASSLKDFDEIDALVKQFKLSPVYIMPEGIQGDKLQETAQQIAQAAIERNYLLTTRMHILLYGNKRGI